MVSKFYCKKRKYEPRKRLIEKGILDGSERGVVKVRLPRFKEYVEARQK